MAAKLEMKTATICVFVLVCASVLPNCQCQAESDSELDTESQTTSYSSNSVMEFIKATEPPVLDIAENGTFDNDLDYMLEFERKGQCRGVGMQCRVRKGKDKCCKKPYHLQCQEKLCKIKDCKCVAKCGGMGICADTTGNCDCKKCICKFQNAKASGVQINFYLTLALTAGAFGSAILL